MDNDEDSLSSKESSSSSNSSISSSSSSLSSRTSKAGEVPGEGAKTGKLEVKTTPINNETLKKTKKDFWAQKHAVYMKGFPFRVTDSEISNFLFDLSNMKSFKREKNADGQWSGAIVVKFADKEGVLQALKLNKSIWGGTGADGERFIHVEEHDAKKQKKRNNKRAKGGRTNENTIFLGGLPADVKENELKTLLHLHLDTRCFKIRLAFDPKEKSKCRGFGHVEFDEASDKEKALKLQLRLERPGKEGEMRLKVRNPSTPRSARNWRRKGKKRGKRP